MLASGHALTQHAAFVSMTRRVRLRWLLDTLGLALLVSLLGAAVLAVIGRLWFESVWPWLVLAWCALATLVVFQYRAAVWPTTQRVARAADRLGLAERVSSALFAVSQPSAVAPLLLADAQRALDRVDTRGFRVAPHRKPWLAVTGAAALFIILAVLPLQLPGGADATDRQRLESVRQAVAAVELQRPTDEARPSPLRERQTEELQALREALARTESTTEAARELERTEQRLAAIPSEDDYARRRALDAAAQRLRDTPDLVPLASALAERDARTVEQALADLNSRLQQPGALSDEERQRIQTTLQAAANSAAATQPQLASALRRAASQLAGASNIDQATASELQQQLDAALSSAEGLDSLEATQADLRNLRATTLPEGARLVRATGTPTAYALIPGAAGSGGTPVAAVAVQGPNANGAGRGTQPYDPVYAPTRLGGEPGPDVQLPSDPTGASGSSVELPRGPLSVGDVQPYNQVYADYAEAARQSAARQPLPPNVQGMVDRYFGAIAPEEGGR